MSPHPRGTVAGAFGLDVVSHELGPVPESEGVAEEKAGKQNRRADSPGQLCAHAGRSKHTKQTKSARTVQSVFRGGDRHMLFGFGTGYMRSNNKANNTKKNTKIEAQRCACTHMPHPANCQAKACRLFLTYAAQKNSPKNHKFEKVNDRSRPGTTYTTLHGLQANRGHIKKKGCGIAVPAAATPSRGWQAGQARNLRPNPSGTLNATGQEPPTPNSSSRGLTVD